MQRPNSLKNSSYIYATAFVRTLAARFLTSEDFEKMMAVATNDEAIQVLNEHGYEFSTDYEPARFNEELEEALSQTYLSLEERLVDPMLCSIFRLKYDIHNIKVVIKSTKKDAVKRLFFKGGSISEAVLEKSVRTMQLGLIDGDLASAIRQAKDEMSRSGDPQQCDQILDKSYCDILKKKINCLDDNAFILNYLKRTIDIENVRTLIRAAKSHLDASYVKSLMIQGGSVNEALMLASSSTPEILAAFLTHTPLASLALSVQQAAEATSLVAFDRDCDNALIDELKKAKQMSPSPAVLFAYLAAYEYEVMNIRVLFAARAIGASTDAIQLRLRKSYV